GVHKGFQGTDLWEGELPPENILQEKALTEALHEPAGPDQGMVQTGTGHNLFTELGLLFAPAGEEHQFLDPFPFGQFDEGTDFFRGFGNGQVRLKIEVYLFNVIQDSFPGFGPVPVKGWIGPPGTQTDR